MRRKLASIQKIINIQPIMGADQIEVVTILGWKIVVRKDENFKVGQKVIYCEIDSILPDKPEYQFLKRTNFRVKTIKLRKQISQGLVISIDRSGLSNTMINKLKTEEIGKDVSKLLGITKYIATVANSRITSNKNKFHWTKKYKLTNYFWRFKWFREFIHPVIDLSWPAHISKTDEERIQNIPEILKKYKDYTLSVTEKIDYQSVTFTKIKNKLVVCSRNLQNIEKTSLYWRVAEKYKMNDICKQYDDIVIQGEQGGPGVQKNLYKMDSPVLFIFNVIIDGRFLSPAEMKMFCNKHNLQTVPYLGFIKMSQFNNVDDIIKFAEGKSVVNPNIQREGLVFRYIVDGKKVLSFKAINNKFLLKYD